MRVVPSFGLLLAVTQAAICFLTIAPSTTFAAPSEKGFEVQGQVHWEIFSIYPKDWTFEFSAKVSGNTWEIRATPSSASAIKDLGDDETAVSSNGKTLYKVTDFRRAVAQRAARGELVAINTADASVSDNIVPNDEAYVAPIWLAFCSESYFRNLETNQIIVPIRENVLSGNPVFGRLLGLYSQRAFWVMDDGLPHCLQTLYSLDDGYIKRADKTDDRLIIRSGHYPAPNDSGFTNIAFEVKENLELGGFHLPKIAELTVYRISGQGAGSQFQGPVVVVHKLRLEVKKERILETGIEFPPRLPGIAIVGDSRFSISNQPMEVTYFATNSIPSMDDVERMPEFERTKQHVKSSIQTRQTPKTVNSKSRFLFWIAGLAATFLFVGLLYLARKRRQKQQQP